MTTTTAPLTHKTTTDNFTQVYNFTLNKLHRSEEQSTDTVLYILNLLLESEQHVAVHALELWLFCEARKISLNIKDTELQRKNIEENIIQRFVALSNIELQAEKVAQIQEITQAILQKMGFQI